MRHRGTNGSRTTRAALVPVNTGLSQPLVLQWGWDVEVTMRAKRKDRRGASRFARRLRVWKRLTLRHLITTVIPTVLVFWLFAVHCTGPARDEKAVDLGADRSLVAQGVSSPAAALVRRASHDPIGLLSKALALMT